MSPNSKISSKLLWTLMLAMIAIFSALYTFPHLLRQETLLSVTEIVEHHSPAAKLLGYAHPIPIIDPVPEPYHSPPSFCNLSERHYTNHFPSDQTIEEIIAKRSEPISNIPMCPSADSENYNQYKDILSKLPNNLIPYANRCQINAIGRGRRQFGGLLSGDPLLPDLSTQIGFLHVYKAGGTTVRDTMNNILPGLGRTIWHSYRYQIRPFMSHLFMFSHVRDPITRTISSYFELHRRNETELVKNRMIGIDSFRYLLAMLQGRMDCALCNKDKHTKMSEVTIGNIYFNMHIMPQMYFLTEASNPWRAWPVNYVGNMSELSESTFEILYDFYWNTSDYLSYENKTKYLSKAQALELYNDRYHHGRDRHNQKYLDGGERKGRTVGTEALQYQIERADLSDSDIRQICDLYWMDYICLPFPMPKQCNLTDLLLRHYGDDVEYKECWEYETMEWDPKFVKTYDKTRQSVRNRRKRKGVNIGNGKTNAPNAGWTTRAALKQRNQQLMEQYRQKHNVPVADMRK